MRIDQRNAGANVSVNDAAPFYAVDRFEMQAQSGDGVFDAERSTTAPDGFTNSLKITVTTADASIGATQSYMVRQKIEGFNVGDLDFGSSSAKTITLSFYVRSSNTGTFGGAIINGGFDRSYPFSYDISSVDTWEQKTITISGDTTGTWATGNTSGMVVSFSLGAGSSRVGTAGAWAGSNYQGVTGQVNPISTLNATWFVTGVQLEVGSVATPFERRPFGAELALCQRYFQFIGGTLDASFAVGISTSATTSTLQINFLNTMRASPTISTTGTFFITDNYSYNTDFTSISSSNLGVTSGRIAVNHTSGATTNRMAFMQSDTTTPSDNGINLSAEL
jgi:hypothetical protein